jgi:hypothetical protein
LTHPIVYVDRSRIRDGMAEQVRQRITRLVDFIDSRESQLIGYEFYFDDSESEMTVIAIHPDSRSLETHMEVGREAFREFADFIEMQTIQVYGEPGVHVRRLLDQKAEMLGEDGTVEVHDRKGGFSRIRPSD